MSEFNAQLRLFIEQKPEHSEDCEPVLHLYPDGSGLLAVFDGAGGAGGTSYSDGDGGSFTGAFIASRLGRKILLDFFNELKQESKPFAEDSKKELEASFKTNFKTEIAKLQTGTDSKIKSSLIRSLPTTMAAIYYEKAENVQPQKSFPSWQNISELFGSEKQSPPLKCSVLWAGDSRCYLLAESSGLQQLTEDDLKTKGDALANLIEDSPMSNFINADVDFVMNYRRFAADLPVVLIAATDGCFNFVHSPAHFEFVLLETLHLAENAEQWQTKLEEKIREITGDDATMSLIALGWQSFGEIKRAFHARLQDVRKTYVTPLGLLDEEIGWLTERSQSQKEERQRLREKLWHEYKKGYERFPADGGQPR